MSGYLVIVRDEDSNHYINDPNGRRFEDYSDYGSLLLIVEEDLGVYKNSVTVKYKIDDLQRFKKFVIEQCYHKKYTDHVDLNGLWYVSKYGYGDLRQHIGLYIGSIYKGRKQYKTCEHGIRLTKDENYDVENVALSFNIKCILP